MVTSCILIVFQFAQDETSMSLPIATSEVVGLVNIPAQLYRYRLITPQEKGKDVCATLFLFQTAGLRNL